MKQIDVKLSCLIDQDDDQYVLYVNLIDQNLSSVLLEAADITSEVKDYFKINEY